MRAVLTLFVAVTCLLPTWASNLRAPLFCSDRLEESPSIQDSDQDDSDEDSPYDLRDQANSCVHPPDGLVGWWPGDGTGHDVVGGNDGVLENGAGFSDGIVLEAFDLDGLDDFVSVPDEDTLDLATVTVEVWMYPRSTSGHDIAAIVAKGDFTYRLQVDGRPIGGGNIAFGLYCSSWIDLNSGVIPEVYAWTHVAGTYDGTTASIYVNGELKNTTAASCLGVSDQDLAFGENLDYPARPNFDGLIDEISIYDRALSGEEVLEVYSAGTAGKCRDVDEDGITDNLDNCPTIPNPLQIDDDADGLGNVCDLCPFDPNPYPGQLDADGDGFGDLCDNCREAFNPDQADTDEDSYGNACDNCVFVSNDQADLDMDDRGDVCDNCPESYNPFQDDLDEDAVGDVCDNCYDSFNPTQSDLDDDFEGDHCDLSDGMIYITFKNKSRVLWQDEVGYLTWNAYRGDLSELRTTGAYTQIPGSNDLAGRECALLDTYWQGIGVPDPEEVAFFLATGVNDGGESDLGSNSAGETRPNTNPCP